MNIHLCQFLLYVHLQDRDNVHLLLAQRLDGQWYPMKLHDPKNDW